MHCHFSVVRDTSMKNFKRKWSNKTHYFTINVPSVFKDYSHVDAQGTGFAFFEVPFSIFAPFYFLQLNALAISGGIQSESFL